MRETSDQSGRDRVSRVQHDDGDGRRLAHHHAHNRLNTYEDVGLECDQLIDQNRQTSGVILGISYVVDDVLACDIAKSMQCRDECL